MDALLRDLERRAALGDLHARQELRDHWVRLRDPRLHPLVGDVLFGLPRASGRALDPARRASQLDHLAIRFREANECLPVPHPGGWAWARAVTEVRLPERPLAEVEEELARAGAESRSTWQLRRELDLVRGGGIVTWDPVLSWNSRLPYRAPKGGTRRTSLRTFRRWARWSVVLQVAEEEPVLAGLERLREAELERRGVRLAWSRPVTTSPTPEEEENA